MDEFEKQLEGVYTALERYVKYRLNGTADAEDLLQEICLVAWQKQAQLQNKEAFKPWLLSIARNRCHDYFRRKGRDREIPLEELPEHYLTDGLYRKGTSPIEETLDLLTEREQRILRLFYWQNLSLAEIAGKLNIPLGTVKSRLNSARNRFWDAYPYPPEGAKHMTKLPDTLKPYTIERLEGEPFPVRWEELPGWLIVPRLGEKLSWALYDWPSRKRAEYTEIAVMGKAEVHGIEGVEIRAIQYGKGDPHSTGCADKLERRFVAQLTETYSRYLAESHMENGIRKCYTFLDGDAFMDNWGCGEGNCGNQVYLAPRGLMKREGDVVTSRDGNAYQDVVGRYRVTVQGRTYDTICVMDCQYYDEGVATEQYIDRNGRTVLWRRFNKDDWHAENPKEILWSQKLPDNQRLCIDGETFVHWYDCISDYILG